MLKQNISKRRTKNKKKLIQIAKEEWKKIPTETIKNVIETMNKRIKQVIERKGEKTDY